MCSSEARKPAYRLATTASRILGCVLCTHRRITCRVSVRGCEVLPPLLSFLPRVGLTSGDVRLLSLSPYA